MREKTRLREFVDYIVSVAHRHNKQTLIVAASQTFGLKKDGKVYYTETFSVRFCHSKGQDGKFSGTVLALSKLQKYDSKPFLVVLTTSGENYVYLANTTFLNKISHSSKELREDNIVGSFLGSNIIRNFQDIENCADNVERLYAFHLDSTPEENLRRLVDSTNAIEAKGKKYQPDEIAKNNIFSSISRAIKFVKSKHFSDLCNDLHDRVEQCKEAILAAAHIENVNIRGRLIEVLICCDPAKRLELLREIRSMEQNIPRYKSENELADFVKSYPDVVSYTDVKTKVLYLKSNPKAYNIDKFLECMAFDSSVFMFYFVGVNEEGVACTALCSAYHRELVDATYIQHHWCGRNSRGVTQFDGECIESILNNAKFQNVIEEEQVNDYLHKLLSL